MSTWSPFFIAAFSINCVALVALKPTFAISLFARRKWVYRDKRDLIFAICLPLTIFAWFIYLAIISTQIALSELDIVLAKEFILDIFASVFSLITDIGLVIMIPRVLAQRYHTAGKSSTALTRFAISGAMVVIGLRVGLTAFECYLTYSTRNGFLREPFGKIAIENKLGFTSSLLYMLFTTALLGFSVPLTILRRDGVADVYFSFITIPLWFILEIVDCASWGDQSFSSVKHFNLYEACDIMDSIIITVILMLLALDWVLSAKRQCLNQIWDQSTPKCTTQPTPGASNQQIPTAYAPQPTL